MSLSKHTKAELLEMLSSQGIDAKSSMKKTQLIELLKTASASENIETASEASKPKSEAKPSASQPVSLVVGVFVALAILAWIIL